MLIPVRIGAGWGVEGKQGGLFGRCKDVTKIALVVLAFVLIGEACRGRGAPSEPRGIDAGATTSAGSDSRAPSAAADAQADAQVQGSLSQAQAMSDRQLGELIESLSEPTGEFPSDNFVSNEASYLDVASALRSESLRGRGYVGVGPEQNLTYVALLQPAIAYIVDIRRQNMLEHLALRSCLESADNRVQFVAALTSRKVPDGLAERSAAAPFDEIAIAFATASPSVELRDRAAEQTTALAGRLGLRVSQADRRAIHKTFDAFYSKGLGLTYSMQGSGRRYPSLGETLSMRDSSGAASSFLGSEASYLQVRAMVLGNRVVPLVGDFVGKRTLAGVARDMRSRGLLLGVFYTSNVEQYLFAGAGYGPFVANVRSFPTDRSSAFVRVWFDQGRRHPRQRPGHRTTSLVMRIEPFLAACASKPYRSYWAVATDETCMIADEK
jgi:hypothetical protein